MKNLTVAVRIQASFAVVLALFLLAAGVSIWRFQSIQHSIVESEAVATLAQTATQWRDAINSNYLRARLELQLEESATNAVARGEPAVAEAFSKQLQVLQTQTAAVQKTIAELQKALAETAQRHPDTQPMLEQEGKARNAFLRVRNGLIEAQPQERASLLVEKVEPALNNYLAAVSALVDYYRAEVREHQQQEQSTIVQAQILLGLVLGVAVLLSVALALTLTRAIARPLQEVAAQLGRVAQGDLSADLQQISRGDEIGQVYHSTHDMTQALRRVVGEVRQASERLEIGSAEIAQGNHDLSARTESQASALEQTAASMAQLNGTVQENAESARQANQLAQNASQVALQGGEVVAQVVGTMHGINEASRKISDIIQVIDGIAFQTNILALNAAVEAARAGEQGRGFAVVASEVRSLAGRSADAAREIKALIGTSVARVEQGSQQVDQAGQTMSEVVSAIHQVTDIMGHIARASQTQSADVAKVGQAVAQMDQDTQHNAALVEQMAAAASSLQNQAQELVQTVAVFKFAGTTTTATALPPSQVRSKIPRPKPAYQGSERRSLTATPKPAPVVPAQPRAADGAAEWETF